MREEAMNQIVSFAFDAWLDQIEAHGQPAAGAIGDAALQCGAWMILRRHQLGLTSAMVCERTGLEPWQLVLLEAGMAGGASLPDEALYRLCLVLENEQHDLPWVAAVIYLALGNASDAADRTAERVAAELAEAQATPAAATAPELDDAQYYVLAACENGPLNALGVRDAIAGLGKTIKLELPTIWSVTQELVVRNILVEIKENPAGLPRYQISEPYGQQVLQIEQAARALRERTRKLEEDKQQIKEQERKLQQARQGLLQGNLPAGT